MSGSWWCRVALIASRPATSLCAAECHRVALSGALRSTDCCSARAAGSAIPSDRLLACCPQVKAQLRAAVHANDHPAVGMWLVGNEINL